MYQIYTFASELPTSLVSFTWSLHEWCGNLDGHKLHNMAYNLINPGMSCDREGKNVLIYIGNLMLYIYMRACMYTYIDVYVYIIGDMCPFFLGG